MNKEIIDIDINEIVGIEYENNDADTDRGILRDRCFILVFKDIKNNDVNISLSEEDFFILKNKMEEYKNE